MKDRLLVKVSLLPVMLAGYLLISGVPAVAQSESCSNRTLVGDYGFTIEGTIINANLPIRGLALQHYDGRGHITQVDHVVDGGYPPPQEWTPGTGTYTSKSGLHWIRCHHQSVQRASRFFRTSTPAQHTLRNRRPWQTDQTSGRRERGCGQWRKSRLTSGSHVPGLASETRDANAFVTNSCQLALGLLANATSCSCADCSCFKDPVTD